jgi:hypothetical protein
VQFSHRSHPIFYGFDPKIAMQMRWELNNKLTLPWAQPMRWMLFALEEPKSFGVP